MQLEYVPLVTVITPFKNGSMFMQEFVESLRSQTLTSWECILVDDGSANSVHQYLKELTSQDSRFILVKNNLPKEHNGPASARNYALNLIRSPYAAFCDIDDVWHPCKLELQLAYHQHNDLELSVTGYSRFNNTVTTINRINPICPPRKLAKYTHITKNPFPMLTVLLSTRLLSFRFQQTAHEDFLFWLELLRRNPSLRYGCLPLNLAFYRVHPNGVSAQKLVVPWWTFRVFRKSGRSVMASIFSLLAWAIAHAKSRLHSLSPRSALYVSVHKLQKETPLLIDSAC